jgi:hypothetical protein
MGRAALSLPTACPHTAGARQAIASSALSARSWSRAWAVILPYYRRSMERGYSALNVIDGSRRAARDAGTQQATTETPASSAITPP